ncbi:hypothetical protein Sjap_014322 [Stephania japonica]|uniref:Uncharacterized protein n=1 Tax=Stephania japonica TaxID=461633 RepID=A0AAP0P0V5_9MAGN
MSSNLFQIMVREARNIWGICRMRRKIGEKDLFEEVGSEALRIYESEQVFLSVLLQANCPNRSPPTSCLCPHNLPYVASYFCYFSLNAFKSVS